jgi:hypothetical protein
MEPGFQEYCDTPDEGARFGLAAIMTGISEAGWCAGWMSGIEFDLWEAPAGKRIGQEILTERQATLLKLLAEEAGGWWHYDAGLKFVTTSTWEQMLHERANR